MSDLRARLEASISTTYRLERELGRGGMAVVYLAHDLRHKRRVALKVLRPEISALIGPERFLREIETLANLTHPHILPLHDSGEADGLLYYVMPYVDGESLRDRLLREKQLPLDDALRIAREVADALSHAHGRGVIHRDIKPENILFSGGHALVADFGIAAAIDAAGDSRLTETGIAMGTPAYMSPEQALGERAIDARSDVYALGCVLYEMLAGEPPFTGPTAQVVMTRRLHEPVRSIRTIRELVPEAIDQVVRRALSRLPADRFATAERFGDALTAQAPPVSGVQRFVEGIQRRSLWQVLGIYVLGAGVAYLAIVELANRIGFPDWVPNLSIVLFLIGLPVVLATTFIQERAPNLLDIGFGQAAVRDRSSVAASNTPRQLSPHSFLTWRRSLVAGVLAFALLGLTTVGYLILRSAGIGPFATLASTGKLNARDPILLASFGSAAADSIIAGTVVEALRIDLEQSPALRTMQPAALELMLQRMGRPASTRIDGELAREIAVRNGLKAVLVGEVLAAGPKRVITARLLSGDSGNVLVALRETADDSAAIVPAIDRLSKKLRNRAGESLKSLRAAKPLEHVTTTSLDALMRYSQAWRNYIQGGNRERTLALLREAVTIDPTFAMAHRKLAAELWNDGQIHASMEPYTRAWELRGRVSERERHMIEGSYFQNVDGDYLRAAESYQRMIELYPNDPIARHGRAWSLYVAGEYEAAEPEYTKALEIDSTYLVGLLNLIQVLHQLGKADEAEAGYQRLVSAQPSSGNRLTGARLAYNAANYELAEKRYRDLIDNTTNTTGSRSAAMQDLALLLATRGQVREAMRMLDEWQRALENGRTVGATFNTSAWLADLRTYVLRQPVAEVRREIDARLAPHQLSVLDHPDGQPLLEVARMQATLGRPALARPIIEEWQKNMPRTVTSWRAEAKLIVDGLVASSEGRQDEAIRILKEADRITICRVCAKVWLGHVFDLAGQPDSAAMMFEQYLTRPTGVRLRVDPMWRANALEYVANHYDRAGNAEKARLYYAQFVDLWKNADPELQPRVRAARQRLDQLMAKE